MTMVHALIGIAASLILLAFSTLVAVIVYQSQKAAERRDAEFDRLKNSVVYEDTCQQCRARWDEQLGKLAVGQEAINRNIEAMTKEVAVLSDRVKGG